MKGKGKRNSGFTLIEIIVVLVILAILAAFTIPAMLGFITNAREKECISIRGTLARGYTAEYVAAHPEGSDVTLDEATVLLKISAIKSYGASTTLGNLCPSGGTYTVKSVDQAHVVIVCSKHDSDTNANAYDANKSYKKDDIVIKNHIKYLCTNACTGIDPESGNNASSYWLVIGTDDESIPKYFYKSHYQKDVVVIYNGKQYRAKVKGAQGTPSSPSTYWEAVT